MPLRASLSYYTIECNEELALKKTNLFNRNYSLIVVGQIISVVVGASLNFSLGLYVLELTGSSETFGFITAVSVIPWAIFAPLGGSLADKFNQRNIMIVLDFLAAITVGTLFVLHEVQGSLSVSQIFYAKILLSAIGAAYFPSVSSSIVRVVHTTNLARANSVVSQINSLSSIVSPIIAGFVYVIFHIGHILLFSSFLFILSIFVEIFIKLERKSDSNNNHQQTGIKDALSYILKENKNLFYLILCGAGIIGVFSSITVVGLPYIVNIHLGLTPQYYGIFSAVISCGTLVAGTIIFSFPHKFKYKNSGFILLLGIVAVAFLGISLLLNSAFISFIFLCVFTFILMVTIGMNYILRNIHIQKNTPENLVGKVMALVVVFGGFTEPSCQAVMGILLGIEGISISLLLVLISVILLPLVFLCIKLSKKIGD